MKCGVKTGLRREAETRAFQCAPRSMTKRIRMVVTAKRSIVDSGSASLQGTSRKQNEDRLSLDVTGTTTGGLPTAAVFDGHGGYACAEWLSVNFAAYIEKFWGDGNAPEAAITEAFLAADRKALAPKPGMFGMMGERGIGGSKCGATAAVAILIKGKTGEPALLAANAGDARVLLGRGGKALQMTVDHVPDSEEERLRIEAQNPNPRQPLVRYVGGTWRVGGLLALSRAIGDAYLKGSGQFEGIQAGSDGYSSGFGVIAEPDVHVELLQPKDTWVVVSSDGLFKNIERGGGGGLTNEEVIQMCESMSRKPCSEIAQTLAGAAVEAGSTDDVTVLVLKLG